MPSDSSHRAGIREIADALGVSIGTVDRALHGRGGIKTSTRDRVLAMARDLNYTPNMAARSLKLSQSLRIAAFLPLEVASFFDQVRDGLKSSAGRWAGAHVELAFFDFPRLGSGDIESMLAANWSGYDGIVVAPGDPDAIGNLLRKNGTGTPPTVFVTSDAPRTPRLASVAVDSVVSGGIAADLLGRVLQRDSTVVAITGDRRVQDHAAKLSGFASNLALNYRHLSLLPSIESHERSDDAYGAAMQMLNRHPDIGGIYINTADSSPILRAAREAGVLGKTQIVATDLSPELAEMIECDSVFACLYQRPFTQGSIALDTLCRYLVQQAKPENSTRLAPHIVLRSNLPLFLSQIEGDPGGR